MLRKMLVAITVCLSLLIGFGNTVGAKTYSKQPSSWAAEKVEQAIKLGVVPKDLMTDFNKPITREEFCSLFIQSLFTYQKNEMKPDPDREDYNYLREPVTKEKYLEMVKINDYKFTDTASVDVKIAYAMGLVSGVSDTQFAPSKVITREEAACMFINVRPENVQMYFDWADSKLADIAKISSWAKDGVKLAWGQGAYFDGVKGRRDEMNRSSKDYKVYFDPKGYFTREQAICVMLNIYYPNYNYVTRSLFDAPMLKGRVSLAESLTDVNWEVGKNYVRAISVKTGVKLDTYNSVQMLAWEQFKYKDEYKTDKVENVLAAFSGGTWKSVGFTQEMISCGAKGTNAVFDLGFAQYEMNNSKFIFQYKFNGNGIYSESLGKYAGSKMSNISYKRIK